MTSSEREILYKMKLWCDRQERCHSELRTKLYSESLYGSQVEMLIAELISQNYINETRFAQAYVSGKFRIKRWGRVKIRQNLKLKQVSPYGIQEGLNEIDEQDYAQTIIRLIEKKQHDYRKEKNPYLLKNKIAKYVMNRGFEGDLVWNRVNECLNT